MIVILTALDIEHSAISEHLGNVQNQSHRGTEFEVGTLLNDPSCTIAVAQTGMGNLPAAALTERAITEFDPSAVMFVGIAGGLRDGLDLGDVVIGEHVYAYHGGRSQDDEFLVRPRSWEMSHAATQKAQRLARKQTWHRLLPESSPTPEPKVSIGPIAAGDVVLDSAKSDIAERIRRNYNDAVAIEMETAGFAKAAHMNERTPMAVVRGISDHAGGSKNTTDRGGWRTIAANNAAAFAAALAAELDTSKNTSAPRWSSSQRPATPVEQPHVTNSVGGNASVGQMNGVNHGNTYFGPHTAGDRT